MTTTMLQQADGETLVQVAHESLTAFVHDGIMFVPDPDHYSSSLQEPGASFVTLTAFGELRGCIGVLTAYRPLVIDVARNAVAAAARDPRFAPVKPQEMPVIRLSVTVLTPSNQVEYADYQALISALRPEIDGVILKWRQRRAILLPQVWRRIPEPGQFLRSLCRKGLIPAAELHAVPPTVAVHTFQVQHFYEPGYLEPGGLTPVS